MPVHTTGVNYDAVLANAVAIVGLGGAIGTALVKFVWRPSINRSVDERVQQTVTPVVIELRNGFEQLSSTLEKLSLKQSYRDGYDDGQKGNPHV